MGVVVLLGSRFLSHSTWRGVKPWAHSCWNLRLIDLGGREAVGALFLELLPAGRTFLVEEYQRRDFPLLNLGLTIHGLCVKVRGGVYAAKVVPRSFPKYVKKGGKLCQLAAFSLLKSMSGAIFHSWRERERVLVTTYWSESTLSSR